MAISFNIPGVGSIGGSDIMAGIGGITSLLGGFNAASGAEAAGEAAAAGYRANAAIQGENAGQARFAAAEQQNALDYNTNRLIGRQKAAYAAGGVDPNAGSPLDVLADTHAQALRQARNIFYAGDFAAKQAGDQYNFDLQEADAAAKAGKTNATSALLGGFGSALGIASKFLGL